MIITIFFRLSIISQKRRIPDLPGLLKKLMVLIEIFWDTDSPFRLG